MLDGTSQNCYPLKWYGGILLTATIGATGTVLLYVVHRLIENLCRFILTLAVWRYVQNAKMCALFIDQYKFSATNVFFF